MISLGFPAAPPSVGLRPWVAAIFLCSRAWCKNSPAFFRVFASLLPSFMFLAVAVEGEPKSRPLSLNLFCGIRLPVQQANGLPEFSSPPREAPDPGRGIRDLSGGAAPRSPDRQTTPARLLLGSSATPVPSARDTEINGSIGPAEPTSPVAGPSRNGTSVATAATGAAMSSPRLETLALASPALPAEAAGGREKTNIANGSGNNSCIRSPSSNMSSPRGHPMIAGAARAGARSGGSLLISPTRVHGAAVGGNPGVTSRQQPLRKAGEGEDGPETTPRGSISGTKRTRRDGSELSGNRLCVFKLTGEEKGVFMDRIRELYEHQLLCDITLRVENQEFRAHKAVLACSRTFLGTMMLSGMREGSQEVIDLKDISAKDFKILLDYLYSKPITVSSSQVVDLLSLATRYQVNGLKTQMCQAMSAHLDHENACVIFAAADTYNCEELKGQAFSRIVMDFALATRSEGWIALAREQIAQVLSSNQILDCDEWVVFEAAVRWLQGEGYSRDHLRVQVLSMVRFPLMDAGLLTDVIKHHEVTQGAECQALVAEGWEHHALQAAGREGLSGTPRTRKRRRSCSFKKHTLLMEHSDAVSALAVINGKLVSGSWDTNIKVWDPQSWSSERTLSDHTGPVRCFASCAGRLLSGSDDGSIKVWNPDTWSLVRTLDDHGEAVNAVIECAGRMASGSDDGTIKLWNTRTWQCEVTIHQADHTCGVLALATCGDFLVSGSDEGIKVWNTHNWMCDKELLGRGDEIWALAILGDRLASGSIDSTIRVWDTNTWKCEKLLSDHAGPVYALTVLEGKLVSASSDHTIRVWGPNWTCDKVLQCSGVWSLNVFNERLVSGALDNAVKVWGV